MITINVSPSEAHLLLTVLDLAQAGEAFPVGLYGAEGRAQLVDIAGRVQAAVRAAGEASRDWIRPYHLTVLRELAAPDADIGRANWTGSDVAAELEARGLLTFEAELYFIADEGHALLEEVEAGEAAGLRAWMRAAESTRLGSTRWAQEESGTVRGTWRDEDGEIEIVIAADCGEVEVQDRRPGDEWEWSRVTCSTPEELSAALESLPPLRAAATTCPWLTCPIGGHIVLEGRALVPVRQDLPERVGRLAATWEREGELCRFRLEGDGNLESAWAIVLSAGWAPGPRRVDRVIYTAPPAIEDGDHINVAELVLDEEGRPVRFVVADREDLQEVEAAIERVFGKALELGEWMRRDDGELFAEVVRWTP